MMEAEGITYHVPPGFGRFRFEDSATLVLATGYGATTGLANLLRPEAEVPSTLQVL